VRDITRAARQIGIQALTLYAFSSQNWSRPPDEVASLMDLLRDYLEGERDEIMDNDISLRAIGELRRLPPRVKDPLDSISQQSSGNHGMVLTLALSYGGRESLVRAARALAREAVDGGLRPTDIDEDRLSAALPTHFLPRLDLVIRTSGEQRLSNFLLWEAAYAEMVFSDTLWPDFRRQHFYAALDQYASRERRFGLTGDQVLAKNP
jgi:undecaprenyl diphosphate synthase